jgi:hypothetical protein
VTALDDPALAQLARDARAGELRQDDLDRLVGEHLGLSGRARQILRESLG